MERGGGQDGRKCGARHYKRIHVLSFSFLVLQPPLSTVGIASPNLSRSRLLLLPPSLPPTPPPLPSTTTTTATAGRRKAAVVIISGLGTTYVRMGKKAFVGRFWRSGVLMEMGVNSRMTRLGTWQGSRR